MKNLLFVIGAAIIVSISACGKTNLGLSGGSSTGGTTINVNYLIGTWYYTTDTTNYYTGSTLDSSRSTFYVKTDYIQFNSDGSGVEMRANVSNNFTFGVSGNTISFLFPAGVKVSAVLLPINATTNDTRTLASSGTTQAAIIKTLTSSSLVLIFNTATSTSTTATETAHFSQ